MGASSSAQFIVQLASGTYTVYVSDYTKTPTSYELIAVTLDPPAPIAVGDTKSGAIDVRGEREYFQFAGVAGHQYSLTTTTSTGFQGLVRVYPLPNSGDPTEDSTGLSGGLTGGTLTFTPPFSGTYIISVRTAYNGTSTGTYTVALN